MAQYFDSYCTFSVTTKKKKIVWKYSIGKERKVNGLEHEEFYPLKKRLNMIFFGKYFRRGVAGRIFGTSSFKEYRLLQLTGDAF